MAKTSRVVMVGNSRGARNGDVVVVSSEQAEDLVANGHARAVPDVEVKAPEDK